MPVLELRDALREALDEEMTRDDRVVILGEEVGSYNGAYKVTKGLLDKWGPSRIFDTPIAELGFVGLGIGAAMTGMRPVVEFMSWNFSFVAADQIISNAAKMHYMSGGRFSVPIVFRGPNGAAAQVSCQHSHCVENFYANLPGLIVLSPSTPYDAKGLLKAAIRSNNPVLFLENELLYGAKGEVPEGDYLVPIGQAKVVREGEDVTLVSYSRMLGLCLKAAQELEEQGISCEVIDLRSIRPLDIGTVLESIRKTHRCVCVEEGHRFAGICAEVGFEIQRKALDELDAPVERVTQLETPMPYSRVLEAETLPNVPRIMDAVKNLLR
jgi:pyruvate dehydrogenase E1 component beta subunit